jgi:hypothetical protein
MFPLKLNLLKRELLTSIKLHMHNVLCRSSIHLKAHECFVPTVITQMQLVQFTEFMN